ncbi:MAG: PQQ-binding-like beta-propeller repeat protein [Verrucomicrobiota bacterium]
MKVAFTALILASWIISANADWPRWRGPNADGTFPNAPQVSKDGGLELIWKQNIGGGYSGVTAADGRVYTMDRAEADSEDVTERVLCFDAKSGEPVFTFSYEAKYGDLQYGSGPRASARIHDGKIYTLGANGNIHCLDAVSGELIWSVDSAAALQAERPTWGFAATPVIWKDTVIFHIGVPGGSYVAFDKDSGKKVWRGPDDPAGYGTPLFIKRGDRDLMIGWTPKHIAALNPDDGEVIWKSPYDVTSNVSIATPLIHDDIVLASGYWQGSKAINLDDGSLVWENNEFLRGLMSQGFARDGYAWLLDKEHGLSCFELKTGKKLWDDEHQFTPTDRNPQATFVRLRDSDEFLVLNANGELIHATITTEGIEEHWREQLIGKTWAHPAYSGEYVFARDDRSIVCTKLP